MIEPLNLPKAELKLKRKNNRIVVWCIIRKKELVLTPEEWVRQHVIHYLIHHHNIGIGRIASEYELTYNGRSKRADLVVLDEYAQVKLIVECKATSVNINEKTLFQAAQYNHELNARYLFLTNGIDHYIGQVLTDSGTFEQLNELPKDL